VQVRPRRSTVKSLEVREVPLPVVHDLIERHHYTHSTPAAASRSFGVYLRGKLEGAAILTPGARNAHRLLSAARRENVITLSRLWLSDRLPKNAESRVLGIIVRVLRQEGRYKALVTFADPEAGHDGTIYRAAGFRYLGTTQAEAVLVIDGRPVHRRSVASAYGSNHVGHLSRTGVPATRLRTEPKHRYAVAIDPAWAWRLPLECRTPVGQSGEARSEEG
jgi:hypothetical protein